MAVEPRELRHHHASPLRPRRDLDVPDQLLHCERVHQVVREVREIIDTIGKRDGLLPGLNLALFLDSSVQKADVGDGHEDGFAVQLQYYTKHTMGGRMLWTHV